MKQYIGLFAAVIFALIIRYIVEYELIEINSIAFLIITPTILGFIPFLFTKSDIYRHLWKAIIFPLLTVLLFLVISISLRLEDIACLIIIGWPYILISALTSVILYYLVKKKNRKITKNYSPLLLAPLVFGMIEKDLSKDSSNMLIVEKVTINVEDEKIYSNLFEIPKLTEYSELGFSHRIGIPVPSYSTYDAQLNIRQGYFDNGLMLSEKVIDMVPNRMVAFEIDVTKSHLEKNPTLMHVLGSKSVEFKSIRYTLRPINEKRTELTLSAEITINSNLRSYGEFWCDLIIRDFEKSLLTSLKDKLENG